MTFSVVSFPLATNNGTAFAADIDLQSFNDALHQSIDPESIPLLAQLPWQRVTVSDGDSLSVIFRRLGLNCAQLNRIINLEHWKTIINRLRPGQSIEVVIDEATRQLQAARYWLDKASYVLATHTPTGFISQVIERPVETRLAYAEATVSGSIFTAGRRAGLTDRVIMQVIDIFAWDIDFSEDVSQGNKYRVLYEQHFVDGEQVGTGDVIAVEFNTRQQQFRALLHVDRNGRKEYYTPQGLSLRKPFMRTPVDFTRISSGFSDARNHPVLHNVREHKGVDYAAPEGTPVRAVGDGRVSLKQYDNGYGYYIELQHGIQYTTLYAHLSDFAENLKEGDLVRQGDIIGYVGSTGLATGPHLHFEFRIDGEHYDPLTVDLPDAAPICDEEQPTFAYNAAKLIHYLAYPQQLERFHAKTSTV